MAQRDALEARHDQRPHRPKSKLTRDGNSSTMQKANGEDLKLYIVAMFEAFGSTSEAFLKLHDGQHDAGESMARLAAT